MVFQGGHIHFSGSIHFPLPFQLKTTDPYPTLINMAPRNIHIDAVLEQMQGPGMSDRRRSILNAIDSIIPPHEIIDHTLKDIATCEAALGISDTPSGVSRLNALHGYARALLEKNNDPIYRNEVPILGVLLKILTRELSLYQTSTQRGESRETLVRNSLSRIADRPRAIIDKALKKAVNFDILFAKNPGLLNHIKSGFVEV